MRQTNTVVVAENPPLKWFFAAREEEEESSLAAFMGGLFKRERREGEQQSVSLDFGCDEFGSVGGSDAGFDGQRRSGEHPAAIERRSAPSRAQFPRLVSLARVQIGQGSGQADGWQQKCSGLSFSMLKKSMPKMG